MDKANLGRRARWYFWAGFNLVQILLPLALLHLLQFPSLLLLPFSKRLFRGYNRALAAVVWGWWAWSLQHIMRLKLQVEGDSLIKDENAIIFCNHQAMSDIHVLLCLISRTGRLGDLKWLVKDAIKYIPGVGWGMLFMECVFVKRSWSQDQERLIRAFDKYKAEGIPMWMVLFPEGTRFKPSRVEESDRFARENQLTPLHRVLFPRTKGLYTAISGLRGHVRSVYSVTIRYEGETPTLYTLFRRDPVRVQCHVRRIAAEDIPAGAQEFGAWLIEDFYRKDRLLSQ